MQQPEPGRDQENISGWLVEDPDGGSGRASLGAPSPLLGGPNQAPSPAWPQPLATPLAERQPAASHGEPVSHASPKSELSSRV